MYRAWITVSKRKELIKRILSIINETSTAKQKGDLLNDLAICDRVSFAETNILSFLSVHYLAKVSFQRKRDASKLSLNYMATNLLLYLQNIIELLYLLILLNSLLFLTWNSCYDNQIFLHFSFSSSEHCTSRCTMVVLVNQLLDYLRL